MVIASEVPLSALKVPFSFLTAVRRVPLVKLFCGEVPHDRLGDSVLLVLTVRVSWIRRNDCLLVSRLLCTISSPTSLYQFVLFLLPFLNFILSRYLCCLFCCPPFPSSIVSKLAFMPPESSYTITENNRYQY